MNCRFLIRYSTGLKFRSSICKPTLLNSLQITKTRFLSTTNLFNARNVKLPSSCLTSIQQNVLQLRSFATDGEKTIKVPGMGDSITEGTIKNWNKGVGDYVQTDELVCSIETDKVVVDIRAQESGVIKELYAKPEETVKVGANLYKLDSSAKAPDSKKETVKSATPSAPQPAQKPQPTPKSESPKPETPKQETPKAASPPQTSQRSTTTLPTGPREVRVKMTRMRERIATRLKDSQNTYAMLTTFNEIDMNGMFELRNRFKDEFQEKHGVKLGFMSVFVKAATIALQEQPIVNAVIDGNEIVYRNYVDLSVAVASPTGLVVPVIRDCDKLSFSGVEKTIAELSKKARDSTLAIEDMTGGTFTISNGGVYGSLMGTPIINPPQSAILGMHATKDRPIAVNGQVVIRPMMYVALTYDHRLVDGREAVTFLKRIKDLVEDPRRFILNL